MIKKSTTYLLHKQHDKRGDWSVHNSLVPPGGWGFSDINSLNPDNDDTSAALRAITKDAVTNHEAREAWHRGTNYLLSMQNQDGGWAAFEKNTDAQLLTYITLENAKDAAIDPSTADLTGRVLEYFGNFAGLTRKHPSITNAVNWLFQNQQKDGSWYGRWGVCYLYGTWAAVTGLRAVGVPKSDPHIKKAVQWLKSHQGMNGGWGESCQSSEVKHYVPLPFSTPSQTAWALDTLLSAGEKKDPSVTKGMLHLISHNWDENSLTYPTGIGLPGQFYIHYHSYNKIFPLLAVGHYLKN